jgi:hypothetical protein
MTAVARPPKKWTATWVLGALGIVVVAVALLTPEEAGTNGRDMSTFSTGPGGAGIAFELAERMGWKPERRLDPLDSTAGARRVDVVLAPSVALGSHEVHRLLENARAGGGLIASLDGDDELARSRGREWRRVARRHGYRLSGRSRLGGARLHQHSSRRTGGGGAKAC